ncbi:helix-turn-helix transcriptional regulator [Ruegeria meonggei]|uniref:helix-turn-helix transcriptional regulator n=1 Tax=Ruegeria meonggei TaxID=1446476 RepID=UPI00366D6848
MGPDWRPKSCSFTFPKSQDLTVYRRIFGADIRFDQTENRLTFAASTLRQEIHGSDPGLLVILRNQADAILAQPWSDQSLARKVRLILSSRIGQAEMRAELMAEHLNMSATNLRRRLNDEETSFRRLRLDVLQAAAREALELTDKSVSEISEDLGYAEISAFNRAFKREEGISPLKFRKRAIS